MGWRIKPLPTGENTLVQHVIGPVANKLVQQAIGSAAGPIVAWKTKPLPIGRNKFVQQAIGPAAGPIVGWRITPRPNLEEDVCPAGH